MKNNLTNTWQDVLKIIEEEITNPVSFKTWFLAITPEKISDREIILSVPNSMTRNMIENKYIPLTKNAVAHVTKIDLEVKIIIGDLPENEMSIEEKREKDSIKEDKNQDSFLNGSSYGNLNPKYTFDSFVIGNSNRIAHAACLAVADSPNEAYNPLFIYGGVGLGKTHLMHAIGHQIIKNNKNAKVVYVSSEKFMNEMIHSIQNNSNEAFREKYRKNVDVILIDDIQFIAGKESTQQELFHTFNDLKDSNKQIILSSDRPPNEIPTLEDRLRTRFSSGLLADIQPPILKPGGHPEKEGRSGRYIVPDDVLIYIATKVSPISGIWKGR